MNWQAPLFGSSAAAALIGALIAVLAPQPRTSALGLTLSMAGVGGVLMAMESTFLAVMVWLVMAGGVPGTTRAASSDQASPSPGAGAIISSIVAGGACFTFLAWAALRHPWRPAGGQREIGAPWIGFRLLSDHLLMLLAVAMLIAVAALGTAALTRRAAGPPDSTDP